MPNSGPVPIFSTEISTPQVGAPAINARVPSIGSNTHLYELFPVNSPNSSPNTPSAGRRCFNSVIIAFSAILSASVTGSKLRKLLFSATNDLDRKNGRITFPAASAIALAVSIILLVSDAVKF